MPGARLQLSVQVVYFAVELVNLKFVATFGAAIWTTLALIFLESLNSQQELIVLFAQYAPFLFQKVVLVL